MKTNSEYWIGRQLERLDYVESLGEQSINQTLKVYDDSLKRVERQIKQMTSSYAKDINIDVSDLKKLLTEREKEVFLSNLENEMSKAGVLDSKSQSWIRENYLERIDKQSAIKKQLQAERLIIAKQEQLITTKSYTSAIDATYKSLAKDLKGLGKNIPKTTRDAILSKKWVASANYSSRVWNNTGRLKKDLDIMLNSSNLIGSNPQSIINDIKDRYEISQYESARLVRTEMNQFNNDVTYHGYEDAGVTKYVYMAVMDMRTSSICEELNGMVIPLGEKETGLNYPPMHPSCRSTTIPYFEDRDFKSLMNEYVNVEKE